MNKESMDGEHERALVARARAGNRQALSRLLEARYPTMIRLASVILGDPTDAHDAAQEAAFRVFLNIDRLEDAAAFGPWSNTIVRRCCLELIRQRQRHRGRCVSLDDNALELDRNSRDNDPLEQQIRVAEIYRQLGEPAGRVVWLRLELGMSVEETAALLGVTEGAVKLRLHRARQKAQQVD